MNEALKSTILNTITLGDKLLVVLMIALGFVSLVALNHWTQPGERVVVEVNGQVVQQLDLQVPQQVIISGSIGKTIIEIGQGTARVLDSACPEKICVKTGKIHRAGELIVCVPNKVVVKIEGKRRNQFDVITQ